MAFLDCTLLTDGSSDVALLPILEWVIGQYAGEVTVRCVWADIRRLPSPPRLLADRIATAVDLYPCHLLFVHRDAEGQDPECRYEEIRAAVQRAGVRGCGVPYICVVPIRMQEAWLLLDPLAIRNAAGNPHGRVVLNLPLTQRIESNPDPKAVLYASLKVASELHGRRLKKFHPQVGAQLVARYMSDYGQLRALSAFVRLEQDVRTVIGELMATVLRQE